MHLSAFSSLQTAARGLDAARQQIAVTGQNTANAGVAGYSRQNVQLQSIPGVNGPGLFPSPAGAGQGVSVVGIERASSDFLDRQVRVAVSQSGFQGVRAEVYSGIEDILKEPGDQGVSEAINAYHAAWQEVANSPDQSASSAVLLEQAASLANRISSDRASLGDQWNNQGQALAHDIDQANTLAERLAGVNAAIRQTVTNGGSANELMDSRDRLAEQLSALTGGQLRTNRDGTADFLVGGNAMVEGDQSKSLVLDPAMGAGMAPGSPVTVAWSHRPGSAGVDGGAIAGRVSTLSPSGPLVSSMSAYDDLATSLATGTNALHATGVTADGTPGGDFFTFDPASPAASLKVALSSGSDVAFAQPGAGALDGSVADAISQLGEQTARPWSGFVTGTGAASRAALDGLAVSTTTESAARSSQLSLSSVDIDEETVNLVTFQHAYQANARIMSAIDEMFDVLINQVGR